MSAVKSHPRCVCKIVRLASEREREREMEPKYQWISRRRLQNRVVRCSLKREGEKKKKRKKKKLERVLYRQHFVKVTSVPHFCIAMSYSFQ